MTLFRSVSVTFLVALATCLAACDTSTKTSTPTDTPEKVIVRFFDLLADGGKLSNREALTMLSTAYGPINPDSFRRWTEKFTNITKIKVASTKMAKEKNKHDDLVATVNLEVLTPSIFGGDFATTSTINLILDENTNSWKIDFLALSVNEDSFKNGPAEAKIEEELAAAKETKSEAEKKK